MVFKPSEIKQLSYAKKSVMTFFHQNVRSLVNKDDEMTSMLESFGLKLTAIMLTETWYQRTSSTFRPPGYHCYFKNRETKRGGGVALLIKEGILAEHVPELTDMNPDYEVL